MIGDGDFRSPSAVVVVPAGERGERATLTPEDQTLSISLCKLVLVRPVAIGAKESLSALAIPITSSSTDVSRTLETDVSPTRTRTRTKLAGVGVVGWSGGVVAVGQRVFAPVGDAEHQ